nr:XRE family transcriptional regulator [Brevundimonas diminuta]
MTIQRLPLEPRGLQREVAARYIGVGLTKFDEMVRDGRMPGPKRVDGRKVWDRRALDTAFDSLPDETLVNDWDLAYGT